MSYKPVKHINFDAGRREDLAMMVSVNAVAANRGETVGYVARNLLQQAANQYLVSFGGDEHQAAKAMGL